MVWVAGAAQIGPLAWELDNAVGVALKSQKKKNALWEFSCGVVVWAMAVAQFDPWPGNFHMLWVQPKKSALWLARPPSLFDCSLIPSTILWNHFYK